MSESETQPFLTQQPQLDRQRNKTHEPSSIFPTLLLLLLTALLFTGALIFGYFIPHELQQAVYNDLGNFTLHSLDLDMRNSIHVSLNSSIELPRIPPVTIIMNQCVLSIHANSSFLSLELPMIYYSAGLPSYKLKFNNSVNITDSKQLNLFIQDAIDGKNINITTKSNLSFTIPGLIMTWDIILDKSSSISANINTEDSYKMINYTLNPHYSNGQMYYVLNANFLIENKYPVTIHPLGIANIKIYDLDELELATVTVPLELKLGKQIVGIQAITKPGSLVRIYELLSQYSEGEEIELMMKNITGTFSSLMDILKHLKLKSKFKSSETNFIKKIFQKLNKNEILYESSGKR